MAATHWLPRFSRHSEARRSKSRRVLSYVRVGDHNQHTDEHHHEADHQHGVLSDRQRGAWFAGLVLTFVAGRFAGGELPRRRLGIKLALFLFFLAIAVGDGRVLLFTAYDRP